MFISQYYMEFLLWLSTHTQDPSTYHILGPQSFPLGLLHLASRQRNKEHVENPEGVFRGQA